MRRCRSWAVWPAVGLCMSMRSMGSTSARWPTVSSMQFGRWVLTQTRRSHVLNILSKIARSHDREPRPLWPEVIEVCTRIPPLWDLSNYVAVHPFVGYTEHRVDQAARRVHDGLDAHILPGMDYYRTRWYEGAFDPDHIASAAERFGYDASQLQAILSGSVSMPTRKKESVLTFAERHDHLSGTQWSETVLRWIARWCSVHVADGGAYWKQPAGSEGLFASWREYGKQR
ncbi:MAG: DUF2309 family protein [Planctomycetia bacterium]|nr:DUF2309 family protein [Planctomycetia bacterium]